MQYCESSASVSGFATLLHSLSINLSIFSGRFALASTILTISLYKINVRDITVPNLMVGMAIFYGGLAQILAGVWAFPHGDTFSASGFAFLCLQVVTLRDHTCLTVFISSGAFWMSFGGILIPGSGIAAAYPNPDELKNALGIYAFTWAILTILFLYVLSYFVATMKFSDMVSCDIASCPYARVLR
jgi:succinate-acetate transporter protein